MKRLTVVMVVVSSLCLAGVATAAQPVPQSGAWKANKAGEPDSVRFDLTETERGYRVSPIRVVLAASCVSTADPGSGVSVRVVKVKLPGVNLRRELRNGRVFKMLRFAGERRRGLPGNRRQALRLKVRFTSSSSALVVVSVVDRTSGANAMRCTTRTRLTARPARG